MSKPSSASAPKRRLRYATLPKPSSAEVPYAKCRDHIAALCAGEQVLAIMGTRAWRDIVDPVLHQVDAETGGKRGPRRSYTIREFESLRLFMWLEGIKLYREARARLTTDDHRQTVELLGFALPRACSTLAARRRRRQAGLPSESSWQRHERRFGAQRAADVYERLRVELLSDLAPHLDPASTRVLHLDGTKIETHRVCPKIDPRTAEILNADKVTCPDGGYVPYASGSPDHSGNGFNLVGLYDETGVCYAMRVVPLNASERTTALDVIDDFRDGVLRQLPAAVRVLSADAGFNSDAVRSHCRRAGLVENIHEVSHARRKTSERRAKDRRSQRIPIEGYPNWSVNGHFELKCACGQGSISRRAKLVHDGRAQILSEGHCKTCGGVTLRSGRWRRAKNPDRLVRCLPGEATRLAIGNPLTFDDEMASIYGRQRMGRNEGLHGSQLSKRFKLTDGKRWIKSLAHAQRDASVVIAITLALTLIGKQPIISAQGGQPPPLALAA